MNSLLKKITLLALLIYGLLGFLIFPYWLKHQLTKSVSEQLHASLSIDSITFNPFLFKLRLNAVKLYGADAQEMLHLDSFYADFELYSLFRQAIHFDEIRIRNPKISIVQDANGSLNFLSLIKEQNSSDENSTLSLPHLIFDDVSVKDGSLVFEDYSSKTPFELHLNAIGFELKEFDSKESDAKLRLFATLHDGGFLDLKTQLRSLEPLVFDGSLNFEASKLYNKWRYIQDRVNVEVADGRVSFFSDFYYDANDTNATRLENLSLEINNLRLKPKHKTNDILNLEHLMLYDAKIFPLEQRVEIQDLALSTMMLKLKRSSKGKINWSDYLVYESQSKEKDSTEQKAWSIDLAELSLEDFSIAFEDSAVVPKVTTNIEDLNFYVKALTLKGENPSPYTVAFTLDKQGSCLSQGVFTHSSVELQSFLECKGLDVAHFDPYISQSAKEALKHYGLKLKKGNLSMSSAINLHKDKDSFSLSLIDANLALNNFIIQTQAESKELLRFVSFALSDIDLQSDKKSLKIKKAILNKPALSLERKKDGSFAIADLIEPKEATASANTPGYFFLLNHFGVKNAAVTLEDNALQKPLKHKLHNIYANLYNASSQSKTAMGYDLRLEMLGGGMLTSKGKLSHSPLSQSGSFELKELALAQFTPYIQEYAHVSIEDGKFSLNGKSEYSPSSFAPDLRVQGGAKLHSFFLYDALEKTQLITFADVNAKSYTLELFPNRLYVDELDVDAFYVDASIDEQRRLNFTKLMKPVALQEPSQALFTHSSSSSFPYKIARANFKSGSAKFADYSIPLKFFTHIHDLDGSIYSISSEAGDTSYVDLVGEIDKYASVKVNGSIDSGDPRVYTDMNLNFKNIDMSSLSGYSLSFAGHEIDAGKLYLDLGYEISNAHLLAKNNILIEQIKLGKKSQEQNATILPLGIVIGLLEDANGIIDVSMPIEGNMDNPDFRYGKIVLESMGSLITSAVSSPFRLLGSMLGLGGEELEYVAFEAGSAEIDPPQREKLDRIAAVLLSKPNIELIVAGQFEAKKDKRALQMQKLINLVVEKSGIKNIQDHRSVMTIEMLEEIYEEYHDDAMLEEMQEHLKRVHSDKEAFRRAYNKELIDLCREIQPFDDAELIALAKSRAKNVTDHLVNTRGVPLDRIIQKEYKYTKKSSEIFVKMLLEIELK